MKSEDLKNSNELEKTEKSEIKKSEKSVENKETETSKSTEKVVKEKAEPAKEQEQVIEESSEQPKKEVEKKVEDNSVAAEEKTEVEKAETEKPLNQKEEKAVKKTEEQKEEPQDESVKPNKKTDKKDPEETTEKEKSEELSNKKIDTEKEIVATEKKEESKTETEKKEEKEAKAKEENKEEPVKEEPEAVIEEKKEVVDYSKYNQVELVNAMRDLIDEAEDNDIKAEIDIIKSVFYKKKNEDLEKVKAEFIKNGGKEEEFVPEENLYEKDIKDLLKKYGQIRKEQHKQLDSEKEENLKKKFEIIEKIKGLINNEESINKTFNEFRDLQREWREIGLVPQSKMKNLWDTYHFHVENFYDYIKINRELRDLDLKKNMEAKIALCESAEELMVEPSVIKAFNTLQKYHEQWREIGPVPRENKDELWERFKKITSIINKKHQEFFELKKEEQKKNLEAKTALCEKVEEICNSQIEGYKDWDSKSKELVELQKVWRTIGFAPKKENNKIYERFRTACDTFFNRKREFYSKNKEIQQNNLQQKIDLCLQAEELKDSTDWKKTTQDFINIQKKWKEIGPVPRKHSDSVWKRFRGACDYFFEKKSEHFSGVDSAQLDNLKLKEDLIAELQNFKSSDDVNENLKLLKDIQRRWSEIGHVPYKKKDTIQQKFREEIDKLFDQLNIDEDKRNMLKFKTKMSTFSESSRGQNKMRLERDKYMNKLKQLENDLVLLDNNIGFFAKSKNAEALIKDVNKKIEATRKRIESLKEKIRVIDEMDD